MRITRIRADKLWTSCTSSRAAACLSIRPLPATPAQRRSYRSSNVAYASSAMAALEGPVEVTNFVEHLNTQYEQVHKAFETNFWATKMALKGNSSEELARTKNLMEDFLGNIDNLKAVREKLQQNDISEEQRKVLKLMERTFTCYITEDPQAKSLKEQLNKLEAELAESRNLMNLGYVDPATNSFKKASSVQLRNIIRVNEDEAARKSAYEGLRSIGPYVAERFLEIVKLRNRLARLLSYEDFYDYKVSQAEGFNKRTLFEILDGLESRTRPIMEAARAALAKEKGESALEPHNMSFALAGDTSKAMDPYFPFEDAVDVWGRTFAALGINYKGAVMTLDLCDRDGKYSNGFCHWPQPAWRKADGTWVPSHTNFTSLAIPDQVGSGFTALTTLLHEGGHAAHFANVDQHSPLFSQERAPTSVAYAENQSMFLDSYANDAAWLGRYARSRDGTVIPWQLIEDKLRKTHAYEVFGVSGMLSVCYLEKALYELPEEELTVERLLALADETEKKIQGGLSPRPILSVPHILADESSAYYHGYVMAEMSVHQTREHFKKTYGKLIDNEKIGEDLAKVYWQPGNSAMFLDLVKQLTGEPLTSDAWVNDLNEPLEHLIAKEKADYEEAVKVGPRYQPGQEPDLGMSIVLVHGDEVIADSREVGGFQAACAKFKAWVQQTYTGAAKA